MTTHEVILDTNFLLVPGQFGVDIFDEIDRVMTVPYTLCVVEGTIEELKSLQSGKSGDARAASLGLEFVKDRDVYVVDGHEVDDVIAERAGDEVIVATQDVALQDRVRANDGRVLKLRQKSHVVLEE